MNVTPSYHRCHGCCAGRYRCFVERGYPRCPHCPHYPHYRYPQPHAPPMGKGAPRPPRVALAELLPPAPLHRSLIFLIALSSLSSLSTEGRTRQG